MAGKNVAVFGIYANRLAAEEGVNHLRSAGFRGTDVSVLYPDNQGTKDFGHEKNTKAPEGSVTGALAGAILGGVLGWLAAIGTFNTAGLQSLSAAGPIVAALAGAGAIGILGGIVGALIGMTMPEYEAVRFEGRIRDGGILLSVHCDNHDWTKRAKDILEQTGAQDIAATHEKSGDFANADKPMPRTPRVGPLETTREETIYPTSDFAITDRPTTRIRGARPLETTRDELNATRNELKATRNELKATRDDRETTHDEPVYPTRTKDV